MFCLDEALDDKYHPIGNFETIDETEESIHHPGGESRASLDYSVEVDDGNDVDMEYISEKDFDKLLEDRDIGRYSSVCVTEFCLQFDWI